MQTIETMASLIFVIGIMMIVFQFDFSDRKIIYWIQEILTMLFLFAIIGTMLFFLYLYLKQKM
jgi:hypothetical protein